MLEFRYSIGFKDRVQDLGFGIQGLLKERIVSEIAVECIFGRTSAIYEKLYDSGLINDSFSAEFSSAPNYSYVALGGESHKPREIYDFVKKQIAFGLDIAEDDFERTKHAMMGEFYRDFNDSERLGRTIIGDALCGINSFDYVAVLEKTGFAEVKARVKELFVEKNMVLSIVEN